MKKIMTLVILCLPLTAVGNPTSHAPVHLSPTQQQMIGVTFGTVEKKELFKSIDSSGRVAFDPELYTAQNEYLEAIRQLDQVKQSPIPEVIHSAKRMVESSQLRLKILGLSDAQIQKLARSKTQGTGTSLLISTEGNDLWVYAEIYEMDLPYVQPRLKAIISGWSLGGKTVEGEVVAVDRVINPSTRTSKARILIPNARTQLRPESYVDVSILSPLGEQITVPFDAILDTGKESWVFVADSSGKFEPRLITIKLRSGNDVAIESGLDGGERIVTSANFLIDSESRLKGVVQTQTPDSQPQCPKGQVWHAQMNHCM